MREWQNRRLRHFSRMPKATQLAWHVCGWCRPRRERVWEIEWCLGQTFYEIHVPSVVSYSKNLHSSIIFPQTQKQIICPKLWFSFEKKIETCFPPTDLFSLLKCTYTNLTLRSHVPWVHLRQYIMRRPCIQIQNNIMYIHFGLRSNRH